MMKIFIWKDIEQLTDHYHSGGGLAVIADSEDRARTIASQYKDYWIYSKGDIDRKIYDEEPYIKLKPEELPDYIFNIEAEEERVIIFPDKGCC